MLTMRAKIGFLLFAILAGAISINALYLQQPRATQGPDKGETIRPGGGGAEAANEAPRRQRPTGAAETVASTGADGLPQTKSTLRPTPQADHAPQGEASLATIRAIQRELGRRGYRVGAEDGRLRIMTREAIIAYEFDRRLALTGEPTERLLKDMLFAGAPPKGERNLSPDRFEANAELVRRVQNVLASLGYGPSMMTGEMDEPTKTALKQFQTERNLAVNGRLSERLLLEIVIVTGKPLAADG